MNKINLKLLADYLLANNEQLIKNHAFSMQFYRSTWVEWEREHSRKGSDPHCGTAGCAIGHGPGSKIPQLKESEEDFIPDGVGFSWDIYAGRVFGLRPGEDDSEGEWDWCFSCDWPSYDNTPKGAAIRILFLLEHNPSETEDEEFMEPSEEKVEIYTKWYEGLNHG